MDADRLSRLERRISRAIEEVLRASEPSISADPQTAHLMAKAAAAVHEAVREKRRPSEPRAGPGHDTENPQNLVSPRRCCSGLHRRSSARF